MKISRIIILIVFCAFAAPSVLAQNTAFTYQGSLNTSGQPANGNYDMQFTLHASDVGNSGVGATITRSNVAVVNGYFAVSLDWGTSVYPVFGSRWIEIAVRQAGGGAYTTLSPRELVKATPYAISSFYSETAKFADFLGGRTASEYTLTTDPRLSDARNPLPNSPSYIQNGTGVQNSSSFNISGNGTVGGALSANSVNSASQYLINGQNALFMNADTVLVGSAPLFAQPSTGNTIIGRNAGDNLFQGNSNTYTGKDSGKNLITGSQNSFFGAGAGRDANNGNLNTYIGAETGSGNSSGANFQTMIGAYADVRVPGLSNATAIGFRAAVDRSNSLVLGSSNGINGATADTNVGIGTSSPAFRLDVVGRMRLQQTLNASGGADSAGLWLYQRTPNADRAFIGMQDDGKVGFFGTNGGGWGLVMDTGNGRTIINQLGVSGATPLCRNASNELATCSSSARYKNNITAFSSGLDLIRRLRPVSFNWTDGGLADLGLVAEEVAAAEPLLTTTNAKGEVEGVKYDRVAVVLVNAVKEQQTQIEAQQKQIEQQQAEIEKQRAEIEQQKKRLDALTEYLCSKQADPAICGTP
ncbi:MAG: tail fiber domain-containing protein [Acidobacteria bacterium]|nr:tail fiber domain-containing protein [Acidobacteriota bacterium]